MVRFKNLIVLITTYNKGDIMSEKIKVKFKKKDKTEVEETLEMEKPKVTIENGFKVTKMILGYVPEGFKIGEKGVYPRVYNKPATIEDDDGNITQDSVIIASKAEKIELSPAEQLSKVDTKLSKVKAKYASFATSEAEYKALKALPRSTLEAIGKVTTFDKLSQRFESLTKRISELEARKRELQKEVK